jgi:CheY-like chemotaxis protein
VASVVEIVEDALDLILSGSGIRRAGWSPACRPSKSTTRQIAQVFHNIILNAKEAMGESGICASTWRHSRDQCEATTRRKRGTYLEVELADDGPGIPDDAMSRLFTPYHTTKAGGSGLGLATSYSILRKHGGDLRVSSRPGEGATFTVSCPSPTRRSRRRRRPVRTERHGRLLLMDDEGMICDLFRDMVSTPGLELDVARNSGEAVRSFRHAREEGRPHDLVFLDLTIPGDIGGINTLELLRAIDAKVTAIATSGYTASEVFTDPGKYHFQGHLAKPFGLEELQTILDRHLA